jgi:hypothetical protein
MNRKTSPDEPKVRSRPTEKSHLTTKKLPFLPQILSFLPQAKRLYPIKNPQKSMLLCGKKKLKTTSLKLLKP